MLKAVLKKSREGGKGNKKDSGMNITQILPNVGELCILNLTVSLALLQQRCPILGHQVAPGAEARCKEVCSPQPSLCVGQSTGSSNEPSWEVVPGHSSLDCCLEGLMAAACPWC